MKFWLSKTGEVSLREQLAVQIILGIVSGDLSPGQRLPSTRELARRYDIHANTVSAAYRNLAQRGWVEFRQGSGIFVRPDPPESDETAKGLDQLVASFLQRARQAGFLPDQIRAGVDRALSAPSPDHFLVIEPDAGLREILSKEIAYSTGCSVTSVEPSKLDEGYVMGAIPVALANEIEAVRLQLQPTSECVSLRLTSILSVLSIAERPGPSAMLAIASIWPEFIRWARTMLLAAGIDSQAIISRDARRSNWRRGLESADLLICDLVTARRWGDTPAVRVFKIVSEESLSELRALASECQFPVNEARVQS